MTSEIHKIDKNITRLEKEMAIQISEMENYKWICSERCGSDIGRKAYFEWIQNYSKQVREWLESLPDEEIDRLFDKVSDKVKKYIQNKTH